MSLPGISLCCRFAYPPNSLFLCGPEKQKDLRWYSENQKEDKGTSEILSQFSTLYPYLRLIASFNNIPDIFDERVVAAYWIGNSLLKNIPIRCFVSHLEDDINLKKKIKRKDREKVFEKITKGGLPHHSFHVLNIYKRTGHLHIPQTIETMDACIINSGKVTKITPDLIYVKTQPLTVSNGKLIWGNIRERQLIKQGQQDILTSDVTIGDYVSYHWGHFCTKLSLHEMMQLRHYTEISMHFASLI